MSRHNKSLERKKLGLKQNYGTSNFMFCPNCARKTYELKADQNNTTTLECSNCRRTYRIERLGLV